MRGAVKAWKELEKPTRRQTPLFWPSGAQTKIRFRESRPSPQDHLEPHMSPDRNETVCSHAGYTNVPELIARWRTLHRPPAAVPESPVDAPPWGEALSLPPAGKTKTIQPRPSTYERPTATRIGVATHHAAPEMGHPQHPITDNLLMLTLNRGGPVVWMSEIDAQKAGLVDNDCGRGLQHQRRADGAGWLVSQRIKQGTLFIVSRRRKRS